MPDEQCRLQIGEGLPQPVSATRSVRAESYALRRSGEGYRRSSRLVANAGPEPQRIATAFGGHGLHADRITYLVEHLTSKILTLAESGDHLDAPDLSRFLQLGVVEQL